MHEDLTWMRIGTIQRHLHGSHSDLELLHEFPSWSPFSCHRTVEFNFFNKYDPKKAASQQTVETLACNVEWSGKPFMSRLCSSNLVLNGPTREISLSEATEIRDCNPPYLNVDGEILDVKDHPRPWRCAVQWDQVGHRDPGRWLCLLLQRQSTSEYELGRETFLVLETVKRSVDGFICRRIGMGSLGRSRYSMLGTEHPHLFDLNERQTITLV